MLVEGLGFTVDTQEHGDVEDGAAAEQREGAGARLDPTELLEGAQFCTCQNAVAAGLQLVPMVDYQRPNGFDLDLEVRRHHRRRHMHAVR
jgi:hypothetical protein